MPNEVSDKALIAISNGRDWVPFRDTAKAMARELLTLRNQPTAAEVRDAAFAEVLGILGERYKSWRGTGSSNQFHETCVCNEIESIERKIEQLRSGANP